MFAMKLREKSLFWSSWFHDFDSNNVVYLRQFSLRRASDNWKMFLFRCFGLTFLEDKIYEIKYHKSLRIINISWISINLAVFIFLIISPSTQIFTRNYSHLSELIVIADYVLALLTVLVVFIHVQLVNEKDLSWHEKLHQLDRLLQSTFNVTINHEAIRRRSLWKVLITFIGLVGCSAISIHYATEDEIFIPVLYVQFQCLRTIINLRYIQNFTRIDFIKEHILAVREAVQKTVEQNTVQWKIVLVSEVGDRKHQGKKIDDVDDVLMFKKLYATLFETTKLLDSCFGSSLLVMISFTFIDLTFNFYWFCVGLLHLIENIRVVDCIFDIIPTVVTISCFVYSSYDLRRKAREMVSSIIKLYTNTTSSYNKMVKEFLMQTHHQRIENSVNDFFTIDFQLLTAVSWITLTLPPQKAFLLSSTDAERHCYLHDDLDPVCYQWKEINSFYQWFVSERRKKYFYWTTQFMTFENEK